MSFVNSSKNKKLLFNQGAELVEFYRQNPCIAAWDLCRSDLAPIQRVIFQDMWFKNYVIGVMGRGCGKSTVIDSLSFIDNKGLCYLYEEFPKIPSFLSDGDTIELSHSGSIYTSDGFRPIKNISLEKNISGLRLKTKAGFENKGSFHHPLLTIDEQGNFYYKQLQDFKVGDYVCIQRGQNVFGKESIPLNSAYLIGLFIGDGSIGKKYTPSITTSDSFIEDFCVRYCEVNNIEYKINYKTNSEITIDIYFKKFSWFFEKYNIKRCLSYHKEVPKIIRSSDKNTQINFLKGLFDTDGGFEKTGVVTLCSVSKKLIKEVQMMLLNFGIISGVRKKKTKSKFGKAFILTIGSDDVKLFYETIGFNIKYKQELLKNSLNNKKLNTNKNIIPFIKNSIVKELAEKYGSHRSFSKLFSDKRYRFDDGNRKNLTYSVLDKIVKTTEFYKVDHNIYNKLKMILDNNYYFDEVKSLDGWSGDCYDFEMDMQNDVIAPNYLSNGFINHNTYMQGLLAVLHCLLYPGYRVGLIAPTFRQSKMMFSEVEKLYSKSSIIRQACEKRPTRGTDTCFLRFKAVGGYSGSYIEALPLGADGAKIRGSRFYLICIDELAQVPDKVLDLVVRPFASVSLEPMEKVRRLEKQRKLIEEGLATEDDFEEESVNKMVMTSSGFFKFNHMWRRMKDHWDMMDKLGDASKHVVYQIPYWFMPQGFLEMDSIEEAKRTMSSYEFKMEYEAAMISDSEGFFKASLLEECTNDSGVKIELTGRSDSQYVVGIDPNQGGAASCGVVIIKLGAINKVVNVIELKNKTTQGLTEAIQRIYDTYNVVRIFMDKGGGGKAVMDLLEDGYNDHEPMIDRTDKDKKHMKGLHVLEMVNFNPAWISDANFSTLSLLEDNRLKFPETPLDSDDRFAIIFSKVNMLKSQMLSIIVTQTPSGLLHFDTPTKGQNKDLYSAMILAAYGARLIEKEMEEEGIPLLFTSGGMLREHKHNSSWQEHTTMKQQTVSRITMDSGRNLGAAVLHKKIK